MQGKSMKEMYASGGMIKALLADPKQRAIAEEILAEMGAKVPKDYEEGGSVTGGDKGRKKPGGGSTDMSKDAMDSEVVGRQVNLKKQPQATYRADLNPAEGVSDEMLMDFRTQEATRYVNRTMGNAAIDKNAMINALVTRDPSGLSDSEKKAYRNAKSNYIGTEYGNLKRRGVLVTDYIDKATGEKASDELIESMERRGMGFTYDPSDKTNKTYIIAKKR